MINLIRLNITFLPVEIYVCFSEKGYKALCKEKKYIIDSVYIEQSAMTRICTEKGKDPVIAMCFNLEELKKLDKCVSAGVVAHEVAHTMAGVCESIGQDNRKDNEWEAYLIQQMVVDILQFVYGEEKWGVK